MMVTVAVTGASSFLGRALLERLDADRGVGRILGVDLAAPDMPVAKLELRVADVRDPVLPQALEGADVVVHLASVDPGVAGVDTRFALTVHGTRNVLAAAARVGARRVVHCSTAMVYGAHADNDVPLTESAPLRADPDFSVAYQALLAEEVVTEFAHAHPDVGVVVLRPATTLGVAADSFVTRHLETVRLPLIRGYDPTVQFVDVDDVAAALHLAVSGDLQGPYNVAAEGWLTAADVCALLGKRPLHLPQMPAFAVAHWLWRSGVVSVEPGALRYLMEPWVVDTSRLRAAGWSPTRSHREILRAFAAAHHGYLSVGDVRVRRSALGAAAAGVAGCGLGAGWLSWRRWRDRRRPPA